MNYIGIFDSGVGGLGILSEIKKILPNENILYLADNANCPYGEKSIDEIKEICKKNTEFLVSQGSKIVVVACNSASVLALNYLRSEFPNIPIVGVVPVVKTAVGVTKNKRIGILATKATINSDYLKGLVKEFCSGMKIYNQAAGDLVDIVEQINIYKETEIEKKVKRNINPLIFNSVDVIILGCTHFPFLKSYIEKNVGSKVTILDSNGAVARQVKRVLEKNNSLEDNKEADYVFYSTKDKITLKVSIQSLLNIQAEKTYLLKWKK